MPSKSIYIEQSRKDQLATCKQQKMEYQRCKQRDGGRAGGFSPPPSPKIQLPDFVHPRFPNDADTVKI